MPLRAKLLTCGRNIAWFRSTRPLTRSIAADVRLRHPAADETSLFHRARSLRISSPVCHRWSSSSSSSTSSDVDHYRTLGVPPTASTEEIKSAFYKLSKVYHPDVSGRMEEFMKIRQAWEVLGDAEKKRNYDKTRPASRVVEDKTAGDPGWEEEEFERKAREARRRADQEIGVTMEDLKRAREKMREDDKEYHAYKAYHESVRDDEQTPRDRMKKLAQYYASDNTIHAANVCALLFFVYVIVRRIYRRWGLPTETITHEEFYANNNIEPKNEISHDEWQQSDFARRAKWNQNIQNLPEMLQEERRREQELMKRRYKEEYEQEENDP